MRMLFSAEEMHTEEYSEFVRWMSNVWKLNYERNNKDEAEMPHQLHKDK